MKFLLLTLLAFTLFISCSKTGAPSTATPPDPPVVPVPPISLSHPVPLDTLYDWVRIGRVTYSLIDICFTTPTTGFITNDSCIFVTHDNGNDWEKIPNTDHLYIDNLQFIDDQNGYGQGHNSLGTTHDGGATWVFKDFNSNTALNFQFVSVSTGFLSDGQGIQKTQNAGASWSNVLSSTQSNYPFYFLDSLTGFSMSGGNFNKTTNGGSGWILKTSNAGTFIGTGYFRMQFIDSSVGYCATSNGLIKTTDGGLTWINCLPSSTKYMIPHFFDSQNGYCMDWNTIYKTTDGGLNWNVSCKLSTDRFSGFSFRDMNTGWASTFGGFVLRLK
jgi:photosystem II stability/assembly factor-like uncharacterized protein